MSTIKANDIQNASGGIPTVKGQRLIPTAWVNFNGTGTVAIRDSENVSSITDGGSSIYTVNFATSVGSSNYCPILSGDVLSGAVVTTHNGALAPTATALRVRTYNASWAGVDSEYVYVAILGGQA